MAAISSAVGAESEWKPITSEPFSSVRKWSAVEFAGKGWVYLGAPDILLTDDPNSRDLVARLSSIDARELTDATLGEALEANDVFGRVAPRQKQAMGLPPLLDLEISTAPAHRQTRNSPGDPQPYPPALSREFTLGRTSCTR